MSKIPSIYKNPINKQINNNKEVTYVKKESGKEEHNVIVTINNILSSYQKAYSTKVKIKTSSKIYKTYIISKMKNSIITKENTIIPINEIEEIEIIK